MSNKLKMLPILAALASFGCDAPTEFESDDFRGFSFEKEESISTNGCGVESHDAGKMQIGLAPNLPITQCNELSDVSLDLLVVYEASLLENHSEGEIEGWIADKVEQSNSIFANSGVDKVRYNLLDTRSIHTRIPEEYTYWRIGAIIDEWKENPNHQITRLRNDYGADMVVFVTEVNIDSGWDICGIATVPVWNGSQVVVSGTSIPFDDQAFAIVEYKCGESGGMKGQDDFTFAHELGHTFGLLHAGEEDLEPLYPFAFGYIDKVAEFATLMGCGQAMGSVLGGGVCGRIPRLSDPDGVFNPNCKGVNCNRPTGDAYANNRLAVCSRAQEYENFHQPNSDRPPQVIASSSLVTAQSGDHVSFTAQAVDQEDGTLTSTIKWYDEYGALLGSGPSASLQVFDLGRNYVEARVTDSAGNLDSAWLPFELDWEPDPYEPMDAGLMTLEVDSFLVRSFDSPGDVDYQRIPLWSIQGDEVHVRAEAIGSRAEPEIRVSKFTGTGYVVIQDFGLGAEFQGTVDTNHLRVEVRDVNGRSGLGTEYLIRADTIAPPEVVPQVGLWHNPERNGHGLALRRITGHDYTAIWYTFRANGTPTWYFTDNGTMDGDTWRAALGQTTWNGQEATPEIVGEIELRFDSQYNGTLSWTIDGQGSGAEPIQHYMGGVGSANGIWYPPSQPGWGASIDKVSQATLLTANIYDANGQPTWVQAVASNPSHGSSWMFPEVYQVTNGPCPACVASTPSVDVVGSGAFSVTSPGASSGVINLSVDFTSWIPGQWSSHRAVSRLAPQ